MGRERKFLGCGWAFPPEFTAAGGEVIMRTDEADIHESIGVVLGTVRGERVMRPTFGSDLQALIFEDVTADLITQIQEAVTDALLAHEPRVEVERVDVTDADGHPGQLTVHVGYRVRATNSRFNLVFPFYLNEAQNLGAR